MGGGDQKGVSGTGGPSTVRRARLYATGLILQYFVMVMNLIFWAQIGKIGKRKRKVLTQEGVPAAA